MTITSSPVHSIDRKIEGLVPDPFDRLHGGDVEPEGMGVQVNVEVTPRPYRAVGSVLFSHSMSLSDLPKTVSANPALFRQSFAVCLLLTFREITTVCPKLGSRHMS